MARDFFTSNGMKFVLMAKHGSELPEVDGARGAQA
jgi:hypothetical protein